MTEEELKELKSICQAVAIGERSPDELYELLAINANALIEAVEELDIQRDLVGEIMELEKENEELKKELARIQRLPHMDKARASAVIMQVAAQLAKAPEARKAAKQLQEAVDQWATYTSKVEAERDKLRDLLFRSRSVIDELMGDSDLDDDENKEFVLMQKISEVLK
ncbi:MAG: hypothetical protein OEW87_14175 [Flavobacteriaceae bacterium]|nr:hypothetical protein [Flavobacteriaceae bacterium]